MALVLTRKEGGKVMILVPPSSEPTVIELQVSRLAIDPMAGTKTCRLAFEAPQEVEIDRLEVWNKKQEEKSCSENSKSVNTT